MVARTVDLHEAKAHLAALLADVEQGTEVVLTRESRPVARLMPVQAPQRHFGFVSYHVPEPFFDELPEEEFAAWQH